MDLLSLLWSPAGARRLPSPAAFDRAVSRLRPGALERLCEFNPFAPIYFIPTRPFLRALARTIRATGARSVLEVAAGDGHLSRELARIAPDLRITATDSGAWTRPQARMTAAERRRHGENVAGLPPGRGVVRLDALAAIRRYQPDLVLTCWLPPGPLLTRIARAAPLVVDIGAEGYTGHTPAFPHSVCDDLQRLARCRLDERPRQKLHSRITLASHG
jgi:hypothetical protein